MENQIFLIEYLQGSDSSPYFPTDSILVRDEYKDTKGNLLHLHLVLSINFNKLNIDVFDDIIGSAHGNLVKPNEVLKYIDEVKFKNS